MPRVTLYFDPVSPWSFFALAVLKRYRQIWGLEVVLKPTFLGGVMAAAKNKPPLEVINKGKWMNGEDLPLASQFYRLPYTFPTQFPLSTIHCVRFLRAVEMKYGQGEKLDKATDAFFAAIWQSPASLPAIEAIKPAIIPRVAAVVFSPEEVKELIQLATGDEIKGLLKSESGAVVEEEGAFGFPWMVVERDDGVKRNFFGSDRFEQMAFWLGKPWHGPVPDEKGVRASKL
ncbi:hypothetical protein JCM10207_006975 [Rhodosporidiobolus poonsookiae]